MTKEDPRFHSDAWVLGFINKFADVISGIVIKIETVPYNVKY